MFALARIFACSFLLAILAPAAFAKGDKGSEPPNIIILLADDLGYGDLESYGHPTIRTPALSRLAREGQQWTQFYAASPVCTPSRGALLTGRLPRRIGLEAPADMPNVFMSFSTGGLPHGEMTLPMLLRQRGYRSALIGKWHLGPTIEHNPRRHGFDYFFGLLSSNDHDPAVPFSMDLFLKDPKESDWRVPLYRNEQQLEGATNQTALNRRLTDEALDYIRTAGSQPYFMVLAFSYPHVPLFPAPPFKGASMAGPYGDTVEEMDASIAEITKLVGQNSKRRKTIIFFSSDNGPISLMRENGGSPGLLRGGKGTTWEGGMRIPMIAWGPGLVRPGIVRGLGSQLDIFATVAELARVPLPKDRAYDGVSLYPAFSNGSPTPRAAIFYYRAGEIFAIRDARYKVHFITQGGYEDEAGPVRHAPPLVFDLWRDPAERYPLADPPAGLVARFEAMRTEHLASTPAAPSELIKGVPTRPAK
ncbi:MAG: sulfatase-like hydrolase/transferase [Sphingorhabdus sp.]